MTLARVSLIVEDSNFRDFLLPACERLGGECGVEVTFGPVEKTFGCGPRLLEKHAGSLAGFHDIVVIGADAGGAHHRARRLTYRQKARALQKIVGHGASGLIFAVAEPCIEAWILSDPNAFAAGLREASGQPFTAPAAWPPPPKTEREAKEALGLVVRHGVGGALPRVGFEYADEIVSRMKLKDSTNASLRDWANRYRGILKSLDH